MSTHQFTFTMWLYRGRNEVEHEIEVTYSVSPSAPATYYQPAEDGEVEILKVTGVEYTTETEDDQIYDTACDRADQDLAEWYAERDEYLAESRREERDMAKWEMGL